MLVKLAVARVKAPGGGGRTDSPRSKPLSPSKALINFQEYDTSTIQRIDMVALYNQLGIKGGMMSKLKNPDERKAPRNPPSLKPLNYLKEKESPKKP